eukprot:1205788-Amphidinium_carterae.1
MRGHSCSIIGSSKGYLHIEFDPPILPKFPSQYRQKFERGYGTLRIEQCMCHWPASNQSSCSTAALPPKRLCLQQLPTFASVPPAPHTWLNSIELGAPCSTHAIQNYSQTDNRMGVFANLVGNSKARLGKYSINILEQP